MRVIEFRRPKGEDVRCRLVAFPVDKIFKIESQWGSQNVFLKVNGIEVDGSYNRLLDELREECPDPDRTTADSLSIHDAPPGLYRIYWTSGGSSLAAIGEFRDGGRWFAPINWLGPAIPSHTSYMDSCAAIDRLKRIEVGEDDDGQNE